MTILDLQRRIAEAGRIRIGQQVPTSKGKTRPEKLETFRLTSSDRRRIEQAAGLYGGTPAEWQAPAGRQWEVVTETDFLPVIVPPTDMAFSQHYELWAAGGCQRRCDGRQESISGGDCVCDPDERECSIHTRLSVMLRDLPGLGVWRIDTQGFYAAVELQAAVGVIQMAAGRGQMLPARLRLEQRVVKRPGVGTRRFAVPVLDVEVSPGQLLSGGPVAVGQLDHHPQGEVEAGTVDGSAPLTPVPAALPTGPVPSVAEQVAAPAQSERPRRRNAAADLPATGLAPRTAAEAEAELDPSKPGWSHAVREAGGRSPDNLVSAGQVQALAIRCREANLDDDGRHDLAELVSLGRVRSTKELTAGELAQALIVCRLLGAGASLIPGDKGASPELRRPDGPKVDMPLDVASWSRWLDAREGDS